MDTQARSNATRATSWLAPRLWLAFGVLAVGALMALRPTAAQEAPALQLASADELHEIVGPIALYPDDLVAIVLPASTYPLQIVQAARLLEDRKRDSSLQPDEDWDDSVVALLNYPEVLKLLNDDLDWTYDLGAAVLNQRAAVLDAIQGFRDEAYAAGNLRSDERQTVALADDTIEITPADPGGHLRSVLRAGACRRVSALAGVLLLSAPLPGLLLPVPGLLPLPHGLLLGREHLVLDRLALALRARLRPLLLRPSVLRLDLSQPVLRPERVRQSLSLSELRVAADVSLRRPPRRARLRGPRVHGGPHAASRCARLECRRDAHEGRCGE